MTKIMSANILEFQDAFQQQFLKIVTDLFFFKYGTKLIPQAHIRKK